MKKIYILLASIVVLAAAFVHGGVYSVVEARNENDDVICCYVNRFTGRTWVIYADSYQIPHRQPVKVCAVKRSSKGAH